MSQEAYRLVSGRLQDAARDIRWMLAVLREPEQRLRAYNLEPDEQRRVVQDIRKALLGLQRAVNRAIDSGPAFTIELPAEGPSFAAPHEREETERAHLVIPSWSPVDENNGAEASGLVIPPWCPDDER